MEARSGAIAIGSVVATRGAYSEAALGPSGTRRRRASAQSARASKTESVWSRAQRAFTPEGRLRDSKDAAALASILEARLQCTVREAA